MLYSYIEVQLLLVHIILSGGDFMKIALVSGFLNDHLLPLCEELNKNCEFHFIATQDLTNHPQQYKQELSKPYIIKLLAALEMIT